MKLVGAILLTVGTTGLGLFYKRAGFERIRELEQMIWFFYFLESEISYHKSELAQICRRGGERQKGAVGEMLGAVADRMEGTEGTMFAQIWLEECGALSPKSRMKEDDIGILREFASEEFADSGMQLRQAQLCRDKLEEKRRNLLSEASAKGRVYVCMGTMAGLVVSIILF